MSRATGGDTGLHLAITLGSLRAAQVETARSGDRNVKPTLMFIKAGDKSVVFSEAGTCFDFDVHVTFWQLRKRWLEGGCKRTISK